MKTHRDTSVPQIYPSADSDENVEPLTRKCRQETAARAQPDDILAVLLPDGSEALAKVHIYARCMGYRGYMKNFVRVIVLKPTGPYGTLWYISPLGDRSVPFEYTLPVISDPTYGLDWNEKPLNTFRILSWEELQPLTIIPLYRDLDAKHGAEYAKYDYEADQGRVVAAKICLRDAGYLIFPALHEMKPFQFSREIDREHFQAISLADRSGPTRIWTCSELVAEAQRLRNHEGGAT